jgi:primosomal protein N' (replication factor Y)
LLRTLQEKGVLSLKKVNQDRSPWKFWAGETDEPVRHSLTEAQEGGFEGILRDLESSEFRTTLLHGVTGSGKTEIYLNAIAQVLDSGKSALMLVPEIGLTPQVSRAFRSWFKDSVAILHSGLSDGERFDQWRLIRSGECRVVVGTRSAVFAPLEKLGIIIVDEEHDTSYKQEETPRYHGRDAAIKRGQLENSLVLLGSATPQLEIFHKAKDRKDFGFQTLPSRILDRSLPTVHVVDMREEFQRHGKQQLISGFLEGLVRGRVEKRQQSLVLLNRRGFAPLVLCRSCGRVETCRNCSISLTYHRDLGRLVCHYCGYARSIPRNCGDCGKEYIFFAGAGTEKIEQILNELLPDASVARLDRDTTRRKGAFQKILGDFGKGKTDVLVGTQMVAKGHDFPNVTLVGVLGADQGLRMADFRSAERTFQLLTQVAGRAGRGEIPGEVVIQTYFPNHYSLKYACAQEYGPFYEKENAFRRRFRYPPYTALANLVVRDTQEVPGKELAQKLAESVQRHRNENSDAQRMRVLGPAPAPLQRLKQEFRFQVLIKTTSRSEMHRVLRAALATLTPKELKRILVDIDPVNLL